MQDRFKFRVWNKEKQKLYDWDFLMKAKEQNTFFWCMHQVQNNEKYNILMQCTGLKDKNGKLIYEGDILKYKYGKGSKTGEVTYDKTIWQVSSCNFVQGAWCSGALINIYEDSEIIGNVYENQELLGEQQ